MDGEDVNTLAGYLQMAILLCRDYFARISFYLTFWEAFLQIILMNFFVLDMCRTARIFRLEHNMCIKSTYTNPRSLELLKLAVKLPGYTKSSIVSHRLFE